MRTLAATLLCLVVVPAGVFAWATTQGRGGWTVAGARTRLESLGYPRVRILPALKPGEMPAKFRPLLPSIRGVVVAQRPGGAAIAIVMSSSNAAYRIEDLQRPSARRAGIGLAVVANVMVEAVNLGRGPHVSQLTAAFER